MFRWGDSHPLDKYPTDTYDVMLGSRMKTKPPGEEFFLHWQPNLFGLIIATDTYDCEIVAGPPYLRGGDGGGMVCGGMGYFLAWLPLATSYCDLDICKDGYESVEYFSARKVLDLTAI